VNSNKPYLAFSTLQNVVKLDFDNGTIAYNIKYIHPDVVLDNGGNGVSSFVIHVEHLSHDNSSNEF
jgi:hypothetical protein